ncbi:Uncharacterized protein Rs2_17356 [Raphanus sativus]|nr:Uncharacterized protein Rs2_17356 [Raphanus sativus]
MCKELKHLIYYRNDGYGIFLLVSLRGVIQKELPKLSRNKELKATSIYNCELLSCMTFLMQCQRVSSKIKLGQYYSNSVRHGDVGKLISIGQMLLTTIVSVSEEGLLLIRLFVEESEKVDSTLA